VNPATSINAVAADNFNVYPNPVKNNLIIQGENIHSVTIYSITGSAAMYVEEGFSEGINVAAIKQGIYFLKIASDNGTTLSKIIKEYFFHRL
jgi:hypothetical protein